MSKTKTSPKILLLLSVFLLCLACVRKPVQVVNRGKSFYGKYSNYNKDKYRALSKKNSEKTNIKNHQIQVAANDTIYTVSKQHQVSLRDLIKQNNLTPPYKLKSGDILTIPSPNYHEVDDGDTLYSIARLYKMNVGNLIVINDLKAPYNLEVGQKLRVTKFVAVDEDATVKVAAASGADQKDNIEANPEKSVGFVEKALDHLNHFSWPVRGEIISTFGPKSGGLYNDGINIKAAEGDPVKAAEDGVISYAGNELKGYGKLVIIKHVGGWITAYAHLSKITVKRGQKVDKLFKIGEVGTTGNVTSSQLYFGLRKGRDAVNPENYLRK